MSPRLFSERLYLSRGSADVFIEEEFARHVRPFQRDGIRFLYRQYAKKNPGAILNDPPGYGKTVQAVLFIEALRQVLQPLPCLVVCDPDNVQHWSYHFHLWTNSAQDILDDGTNVSSKKEVFITPVKHMSADMSRREWGIVVVDSLDGVSYLKRLKNFKTRFKVWLCSDNLLNNLQLLSTICEWINPQNKLDPSVYSKVGLSRREQVEKDIQLDIFCEDVLLRRTDEPAVPNHRVLTELYDIWVSDRTINRECYFKIAREASVNGTSCLAQTDIPTDIPKVVEAMKKNKDATGLKIKRSKLTNGASSAGDGEQKRPRLVPINRIDTSEITNRQISETVERPASDPEENLAVPDTNGEVVANNPEETAITDEEAITESEPSKNENFSQESQTRAYKYKVSNIHSSMRRIEELANKQFKGSILDHLF